MVLKKCTQCGLEANTDKDLELFILERKCKHGRGNTCKPCYNIRAKGYNICSLKRRDSQYKLKYGITLADYNALYEAQNGRCKICNTHESELKTRLYVDHCHSTTKVRGLLCQPCNTLIGFSYDNTKVLQNAIAYLNST